MEKLFDEKHEYAPQDIRRTLWYSYTNEHHEVLDTICSNIKEEMNKENEQSVSETHFIFYSSQIEGDAIEDNVRFTFYIRLKNGKFYVNINMSDFTFASNLDEIINLKHSLEKKLDSIIK